MGRAEAGTFPRGDVMRDEFFDAWVVRVFGSLDAYRRSLPERVWVQGDNGWYSVRRFAA